MLVTGLDGLDVCLSFVLLRNKIFANEHLPKFTFFAKSNSKYPFLTYSNSANIRGGEHSVSWWSAQLQCAYLSIPGFDKYLVVPSCQLADPLSIIQLEQLPP